MDRPGFWILPQKWQLSIRVNTFLPLKSKKSVFKGLKQPPEILQKKFKNLDLLTFLPITPSILIRFSSVIPFLDSQRVQLNADLQKISKKYFNQWEIGNWKLVIQGAVTFKVPLQSKKLFYKKCQFFKVI